MNYIVRADFYPNGEIIPLGLTDSHGNSLYVQIVEKTTKKGSNCYHFECTTSNDKKLCLLFSGNRWTVEEI